MSNSSARDGPSPNKKARTDPEEDGSQGQMSAKTVLLEKADELGCRVTDLEFAKRMDQEDRLRHLRQEFVYPKMKQVPGVDLSLVDGEADSVYLCGNSLGLQPKGARHHIAHVFETWSAENVHGHFSKQSILPFAHCDEVLEKEMSNIVGANPGEVGLMNGLTVNLHLLMISFYRPTKERHKVLIESKAFPSDHYAVESQIRLHGFDPAESMLLAEPRKGESLLRTEDIVELVEREGQSIACILFCGVQYYTGQVFDMPAITRAGHQQGCYVGFDLAHAVGNIELHLHDWEVDFACWCSYKYLNSGAGGMGGAFLHDKHRNNDFPKLLGWWGHESDTRFEMSNQMKLSAGIHGYRISNPSVLMAATLLASLEVFAKTSMSELRQKSFLLTGYLELLLQLKFPRPPHHPHTHTHTLKNNNVKHEEPYVEVMTPSLHQERGCQLSLSFSVPLTHVYDHLVKRGVACDVRKPNVIRVAPVPLYNSFEDVHKFLQYLSQSMDAASPTAAAN